MPVDTLTQISAEHSLLPRTWTLALGPEDLSQFQNPIVTVGLIFRQEKGEHPKI